MITKKHLLALAGVALIATAPATHTNPNCLGKLFFKNGSDVFSSMAVMGLVMAGIDTAKSNIAHKEAYYTQQIADAIRAAAAQYVNQRADGHFCSCLDDNNIVTLIQDLLAQELSCLQCNTPQAHWYLIEKTRSDLEYEVRSIRKYSEENTIEADILTTIENYARQLVTSTKSEYLASAEQAHSGIKFGTSVAAVCGSAAAGLWYLAKNCC